MAKEKKNIIDEALTDYNTIVEAAEIKAKNELAKKFPEKFNDLIKENLNNKKAKESEDDDETEESDKKDDSTSNQETDMKNTKKETKTVVKEDEKKAKPFEENPKETASTSTTGHQSAEKNAETKNFNGDKEFVDVEGETPNIKKGEKENAPFDKKVNESELDIDISELTEEDVVKDGNEEFLTIDEIEAEINELEHKNTIEGQKVDRGNPMGQGGDLYTKMVDMKNFIDEMINKMGGEEGGYFTDKSKDSSDQLPAPPEEIELDVTGITEEEDLEISDADIEAVMNDGEEEVDEGHGVSFSSGTITTGKLPGEDYLSTAEKNRRRSFKVNEAQTKVKSLIEENKKLTKKVNGSNKYKKEVNSLLESYKTAIKKYRNQLMEMTVFNTNLSHVNNVLVNESLALTQTDKINIIKDFKKIESINESIKKYNSVLEDFSSKKSITEEIETKLSKDSIQESSKKKLDEVVEKTAYENNEHVDKMKRIIETIEGRKHKRII